jgi:hydrogenase expression/formation protein HypC
VIAHDLRDPADRRGDFAQAGRNHPDPRRHGPCTTGGMCLGVPGRIVSIDGDIALVDFWGVIKPVRIDVVDAPVAPGDYVLNHVGFAIRRIAPEDVADTLALYDELLRRAADDDLMAADVRGELDAAGSSDG